MKKYMFFLGGHDAEMDEIKNLLEQQGYIPFDRGLPWNNALLSIYKEDLSRVSDDQIPVFIELKMDCEYPLNAMIIDHHDEQAGKDMKTSIEQVADLLRIQLNRHQQLVSANDKGHIAGMKELCATDQEIKNIRAIDRNAQGVTEQDEENAKKSVGNHLEEIGDDTAIIDSLTNKTSAVFDIIYKKYRHVFIYTPDGTMNYSGTGKMVCNMKNIFNDMQSGNQDIKYWFGGGLPEQGYFGSNHQMEKKKLKEMLKNWNKKIISQHIFMFPFEITNKELNKDKPVDIKAVFESFENSGWGYKEYNPTKTAVNYSEFFYFHKYVRDAIFELRDIKQVKKLFENKEDKTKVISYYFKRETDHDSQITYHIKTYDNEYEYTLKIDDISLRLFETGIGIVSIELHNYEHKELDDILRINDYGRRIYPQYLSDPADIEPVKKSFLCNKIDFRCKNMAPSNECLSFNNYFKNKLEVVDYMKDLLGKFFRNGFDFFPIIDDRMYTVCWYGSDYWTDKMGQKNSKTCDYAYESSSEWYKFLFIDGNDITCFDEKMKKKFIKEHTYSRWAAKDGTFFGITRYSLMCLSTQQWFSCNIIRSHMETMYYQMAVIVLAQRSSILKFAADVTKISGDIDAFVGSNITESKNNDSPDLITISDKIKKLHSAYIRFINRLWFTEVTPQDQGIEMYDMALKSTGLSKQVRELQNEIKELYEFVSMSMDRKSNEQMGILTILGALFLPVMVLTGFFGMNLRFIDDKNIVDQIINGITNMINQGWTYFARYDTGFFSLIAFIVVIMGSFYWMRCRLKKMGGKSILKYISWKFLLFNWIKNDKNGKQADSKGTDSNITNKKGE